MFIVLSTVTISRMEVILQVLQFLAHLIIETCIWIKYIWFPMQTCKIWWFWTQNQAKHGSFSWVHIRDWNDRWLHDDEQKPIKNETEK